MLPALRMLMCSQLVFRSGRSISGACLDLGSCGVSLLQGADSLAPLTVAKSGTNQLRRRPYGLPQVSKGALREERSCDSAREALAGEDRAVTDGLVETLRDQGWPDVRTIDAVPTAEQAASWNKVLVVVMEGLFLKMRNTTHYYNLVNMVLPTMIQYVDEPLKAAGRGDVRVLMQEEARPPGSCENNPSLAQLNGDRRHVTAASIQAACESVLQLLPSMLPDLEIAFASGLPGCSHFGQCESGAPAAEVMNPAEATVLVFPRVWPIGHWDSPGNCSKGSVDALRRRFLAEEPEEKRDPDMVTLILRGTEDQGEVSASYDYERPTPTITNMLDVRRVAEDVARNHSLRFQVARLELLPFADQVDMMVNTKVFIGTEGAGLSNMVFLQEPMEQRHVVEINWPWGKVGEDEEFPTMARVVGVPLTMYVGEPLEDGSEAVVDLDKFTEVLGTVLTG